MASAAATRSKASEAGTNTRAVGTPRSLRRDIIGLTLVAATAMLLVAVFTRDPHDPVPTPAWPLRLLFTPDATHYPAHEVVSNACGYWGAYVSAMLIESIGVSTVVVIAWLAALAITLLARGGMNAPVIRSLGGTLLVLALSTAGCLAPLRLDGLPAVGAGGYLGAMTSEWLLEHFAWPGAWILTITTLVIGLLLSTDYVLWYAGVKVLACGAMVSRRGFESVHEALPAGKSRPARRATTDLDAPPTPIDEGPDMRANRDERQGPIDQEDEPGPTIKVRKRPPPADHAEGDEDDAEQRVAAGKPRPTRLRQIASAVGLGSGGSTAKAEAANRADATSADDVDAEPPSEDDEVDDATVHRQLECDGQTVELRGDPEHDAPEPKIRLPKKRSQLQEVIEAVNEELPETVDEYCLPGLELLDEADEICYEDQLAEVRRKAKILEEAFRSFGFNIRVVEIETGPVIAQYEVELEAGLRLNKITALAEDLAIALRVPSVRVVAPIPGKNTVGIEVPNEQRQVVMLREVIEECAPASRKMNIPVFLGKDVAGNPLTIDLTKMPHLLIAGRTGTGKSVCLNAIITSVLMTCKPDEVRMLMIDPKMVELSGYGRLPHLMHPVVTDMKKAEAILAWAVDKMEERYALLAKAGVRHINSYNDLGREELYRRLEVDEADEASGVPEKLPFIVIVADEMADLMMTAGKEVETHIIRLAQKSRAVGIHLILATQKPTVDVITGLIKSNLPARLSFQVASRTDSRVVLDENGADKLLGNGDMLFLWPGTSMLLRGQGTYLSDAEIDRVVDHCSTGEQNFVGELMNLKVSDSEEAAAPGIAGGLKKRDELYESAIEVVVREGRGSVSLLQRCLGIGYGRAARLIDYMAEDGIVGQYNGSQAREVMLSAAEWERMQQDQSEQFDEETDDD